MTLNARLVGRILSIQKILVEGIAKTPEGAVTDGKVTQYMLIRGSAGNDAIVDSNGNLVCMLKGSENLPIAQDVAGNLVALIKGSEDLPIAQDISGNMIAAMKGLEGANVRDIAVDVNGNMVTLMKGDDGANLHTIKVDTSGQMYVAMTGQSLSVDNHPSDYFKAGEYVGVNNHPSDYFKADESAVVKGDDGGTKRLIAVDNSGIMLSRMKGAHGAVLKDILLDDTGIMLARMKGSFGGALKDIGVDTDGNMISIMKGAAGNNVAVDANGYLAAAMKGLEGANVRDIAVDVNGNMISVMKGNFAGALKTWKVDTDGRGEMFISDPTDVWGNVIPMGLGEHAVRVHAPPTPFDRRGSLMYWDDFESSTLKYNVNYFGGTGIVARTADFAKHKDFSVKHTLAAGDHSDIMYRIMDIHHTSNIGVEISTSFEHVTLGAGDELDFFLYLLHNDGANVRYYAIKYHRLGDDLYYYDSSGTYQLLDSNLPFYMDPMLWGTFKIVIDPSTNKYVRILALGKEYDVSTCDGHVYGASSFKFVAAVSRFSNNIGEPINCYNDNLIITENEPV